MPRNLIIKHDPRAYVHPSSTWNETRRDIIKCRVRKGISGQKENLCSCRWKDAEIWILCCHYPVILYLHRTGTSFRNISHYMTYGTRGRKYSEASDREESERANWSASVCVRVYSSGNGKRLHRRSSTLPRYRAAIELIAKWCVQHRAKCHPWNEIRDGLLEHVPRHRYSVLFAALYHFAIRSY